MNGGDFHYISTFSEISGFIIIPKIITAELNFVSIAATQFGQSVGYSYQYIIGDKNI